MNKIFTCILSAATILCACSGNNPEVRPPMMGWSSWNAYMVDISDSIITHQVDLIAEKGLRKAGYSFVNIDDGFFGYRDSSGYMIPHPTRFPEGSDGMRRLVDYIHAAGLKGGIYSDAGDNTCGSSYNHDLNGLGAGLWNHDIQDAERYFNEWDFDFIKIDFCGGINRRLEEKDRYLQIRNVIDSISNKPIEINICRWDYPGTWVGNAGNSWRISADICPIWSSVKYIVEKNLYLSAYAGGGRYNDMDMLAVGYNIKPSPFWEEGLGLSYDEEEAHFSIWCIMSSPLLLGCDLEYLPEETKAIITNKELIAVNQDCLGLQAHVAQHKDETYVFVKDILKKWGKTRAIALYNPADTSATFKVSPEEIEFRGELSIRDLNTKQNLGTYDSIEMSLPPHSAKVLRVTGSRIEPTRYEAEWGYCPEFTAIRGTGAKYIPENNASGRAVVMNLGGSESNYLEWKDVHSRKGGEYSLSLRVKSIEELPVIHLSVNGFEATVRDKVPDGDFVILTYDAILSEGRNSIKIWNRESILPAIDKIELKEQ